VRAWAIALSLEILLVGCSRHPATESSATQTAPVSAAPASTSPSPADLLLAFKAAYGQPAPLVQPKNEPDAGGQVDLNYAPVGFVDVAPGIVALIAQGTGADCGRFCTGTTDIYYLRRTPSGFESLGAWRDLAPGLFFGVPAEWSVRHDLFTGAALIANGVTGEGNCYPAVYTIIELTPLAPKVRAAGVFSGAQVEAGEIKSTIQPVIRDQSFKLVYYGLKSVTIKYNRIGDEYLAEEPEQTPRFC